MNSKRLLGVIFIIFILASISNFIYAEEKRVLPKVYINTTNKACIDQEIPFYAKIEQGKDQPQFSYQWDFGDGTTAQGEKVEKVYKNPDIYKVKLTLNYYRGSRPRSASAVTTVKVYSPPIAVAGDDVEACVDEDVLFDGSGSYVTNKIDRCFCCKPLTYIWNFGDGTPKVKAVKAKHSYNKAGRYLATLTVHDGKRRKCSTSIDQIFVTIKTNPAIIIRPRELVCPGTKIDFSAFIDASLSPFVERDALGYVWDFGDGSVLEGGPQVSHAYQRGGGYLVKVTADDRRQTSCSFGLSSINVRINTPPVADAGPNLVCCINTESFFDGSSSYDADGDTLSYFWDFGDGATAKGAKVTHVYKKIGEYTVTLSVDDNSHTACSSDKDSFSVSVHDKPVPVIKIDKE